MFQSRAKTAVGSAQPTTLTSQYLEAVLIYILDFFLKKKMYLQLKNVSSMTLRERKIGNFSKGKI